MAEMLRWRSPTIPVLSPARPPSTPFPSPAPSSLTYTVSYASCTSSLTLTWTPPQPFFLPVLISFLRKHHLNTWDLPIISKGQYIAQICLCIPISKASSLAQASLSPCLDYCHGLLTGVPAPAAGETFKYVSQIRSL